MNKQLQVDVKHPLGDLTQPQVVPQWFTHGAQTVASASGTNSFAVGAKTEATQPVPPHLTIKQTQRVNSFATWKYNRKW